MKVRPLLDRVLSLVNSHIFCWPALFSGVTSPLLCPAGYRCPPSSSVPTGCASNEACPVANASCCPLASTFQKVENCPATCPVCPAGSYATQSNGCLPCHTGFYCLGPQPPMPCPASFFCPGNTSLPIMCPAANMCPDTAMGAPVACPDFQTSFMGSVKCDFSPGTLLFVSVLTGSCLYRFSGFSNRASCLNNEIVFTDVTTIAGAAAGDIDGFGTAARFNRPTQMVKDINDTIWIVDNTNHQIRIMRPSGLITTVAGSTAGCAKRFFLPVSSIIILT